MAKSTNKAKCCQPGAVPPVQVAFEPQGRSTGGGPDKIPLWKTVRLLTFNGGRALYWEVQGARLFARPLA